MVVLKIVDLEKDRIQYLKKLFSQKQQKVSLLTGFKLMNPTREDTAFVSKKKKKKVSCLKEGKRKKKKEKSLDSDFQPL